MSYIVTEKAKRPASTKDECYYCQQAIGAEHELGCVLIKRKVTINFTIPLEVEVPASWDKDRIEFHYNESSFCADNLLDKILEKQDKDGCLCGWSTVTLVSMDAVAELKE